MMMYGARDIAVWALFFMLPMTAVIAVMYLCLTAPARRSQRTRLFLDLIETGLRTGQSPERTITAISETQDRSVTAFFHLLAAHIEEGARLEHALTMTPRFLPRSIAEVVKIGARENTLEQLLPAARAMLTDVNSRMRGALNYAIVFAVVVLPGMFLFLPILSIFVWPKLKNVLVDMEATPPAFTIAVFENYTVATAIQFLFVGFVAAITLVYVFGPRAQSWMRHVFGSLPDRFGLWLPWRRYRVHRDFTAVLAILLDAGLKEVDAVRLASQATGNDVFQVRARHVIEKLHAGARLPEALKEIEKSEEFQWRWANALRTGKDFFSALRGWHESLETRAFQQEQAAAHVITSSIVLINGVLVAMVASAVFLIFVSLIDEAALW
jgi:type II secretory pathway component PulF